MNGYIYVIENLKNNKKYIGQTTMEKVEYRWNNHIRELNNNIHHNDFLQNSWKKYGEKNFKFSIIEKIEENEYDKLMDKLNELEIKYIKEYETMYYQNGYNLKEGGRYSRLTEYSKRKISEKNKGRKKPEESKIKNRKAHIGKKWTQEQKNKLKEKRKFIKHPMLGKKTNECDIEKMRKSLLKDKYIEITLNLKESVAKDIYVNLNTLKEVSEKYKITISMVKKIKIEYEKKYMYLLEDRKIKEEEIKNNLLKDAYINNISTRDLIKKYGYSKSYINKLKIENKHKFKKEIEENKIKKEKEKELKQIEKNKRNEISRKKSNEILIKKAKERIKIFDNNQIKKIIQLREKNISLQNIGDIYNVNKNVIKRVLIENNRGDLVERRKKYEKVM